MSYILLRKQRFQIKSLPHAMVGLSIVSIPGICVSQVLFAFDVHWAINISLGLLVQYVASLLSAVFFVMDKSTTHILEEGRHIIR